MESQEKNSCTMLDHNRENEDKLQNEKSNNMGAGHEVHGHRHHSRHSTHHHHGHRGRRKGKQRKYVRRFLRKNKKNVLFLAAALVLCIVLLIIGILSDNAFVFSESALENESEVGTRVPVTELQILVPFFEEDVVIVGPAVEAFMQADPEVPVSDIFDQYQDLSDRLDVGMPVELSYKVIGLPAGNSVEEVKYLVADNREFNNPRIYQTDGYSSKVDVYNLKTGTQYYYRIELTMRNGNELSVSGGFKTASGPRVLTVDGVYNLRDIGGLETVDGRKIRQGLLYRGCEIDGAVEPKYRITPDGVNTMLTVLGIRTDMDLRSASENKYGLDALGPGVKHVYYGARMYASIFNSEETAAAICKIFSDLADKRNYPVYLHCTYGQDRTGTICYLLECLLGVDQESMMKDYQLSGLHHGDVSSQLMDEFVETVEKLPGDSLSDKVERWLLSIGVTANEIDNIREIFLG